MNDDSNRKPPSPVFGALIFGALLAIMIVLMTLVVGRPA